MMHFKKLGCKNEVNCSVACKICIDLIGKLTIEGEKKSSIS